MHVFSVCVYEREQDFICITTMVVVIETTPKTDCMASCI